MQTTTSLLIIFTSYAHCDELENNEFGMGAGFKGNVFLKPIKK